MSPSPKPSVSSWTFPSGAISVCCSTYLPAASFPARLERRDRTNAAVSKLYVHNINTFRSSTHIYNNSSNCNKQEHKLKQTRGCVRAHQQRNKQKSCLSVDRVVNYGHLYQNVARCKVIGSVNRDVIFHIEEWQAVRPIESETQKQRLKQQQQKQVH